MMARVRAGPAVPAAGPREPWAHEAVDVLEVLESDDQRGLSFEEAAARLAAVGPNVLAAAERPPAWRRVLAQLESPLVYLLLLAVAISVVVWVVEGAQGIPSEALVIAAIVLIDAVLGFIQEERAEQAVAALQRAAAPSATVIRDGRQQAIPAEAVVPGDILVLAEGDAIAADGRVIETASLMVAEAPLTGESEPVTKGTGPVDADTALGDRTAMVYRGTAVTRGRGRAVVTATGMATEVGAIADLLGRTEDQETPLQHEVARIGRVLGLAVVVIAVVVIAAILMTNSIDELTDLVTVLLIGVSLAVAAVPESLPAVLAVVLALGVQRMAARRAIVRHLASVETLGAASVICTDKTGTLTRNEMAIEVVATGSRTVEVTGPGYRPEGQLLVDGQPIADPLLLDEVRWVLIAGSLANDAHLERQGDGWTATGDPTEIAFLVAEGKVEGLPDERRRRFERIGEIPFDSDRKLMSTVQLDTRGELGMALITKGAPDVLVGRCESERVAGVVRPLDDARRTAILETADRLADRALRTIGVAYRPLAEAPDLDAGVPLVDESSERGEIWLGMVGIIDPPRPRARAAIAEAAQAGIRTVMITGDHPRTAVRIAADLGIAEVGDRVLTGHDLETSGDEDLRAAAARTSVYARVAPEHKMRIVRALRAEGHVVAMTGDGVNDAPALRAADIGIAMGRAGTDVAREAADLVLVDDDYATIVEAVREGRGIASSIRGVLRFLLSSNVGEVLTMLIGVLFAGALGLTSSEGSIAVPLLATQILWINLLTDSTPALAMAFEPPAPDVMRRRPRGTHDRLVDGSMWLGIGWIGLVMAVITLMAFDLRLDGGLLGGSGDIALARTMAFTTLVLAQLYNCFNARSGTSSAFRRPFTNRVLWAAVSVSLVLQVLVVEVPFLNDAFQTVPLSLADWLTCAVLASVVLVAGEVWKLVLRRGTR
jgi:magnesium-transporting ATPase (P-type)